MKKQIIFCLVASLVFLNGGCTSKKAEESEQIVENADVEKIEADAFADSAGQATDPSLDQALNETTTTTATTADAPAQMETATAEAPPPVMADTPADSTTAGEELSLDTPAVEATPVDGMQTATTTDEGAAPSMEAQQNEITETPIAENTAMDAALAASAAPEKKEEMATMPEKPKVTLGALKKINETVPYQHKDGGWINTVYVARPKEKLVDISMKIFGTDKTADLKRIAENSYLKSRSVKAGDKIYYVSPNRPDDSSKTIFYYEDIGMVPETYVTKKDDDLRAISKNLLKYDDAWKEVWTSNSVQSKALLKDGEILRYWKEPSAMPAMNSGSTETVAAAPAQPEPSANLIDASQAQQEMPQLPPPPEASASLPPPPTEPIMQEQPTNVEPNMAAATTADAMPEPPPPPPPPVEEDMAAAPKQKINLDEAAELEEEEEGSGMDDTMMSMGALGILVALLAFIIIKKKKQKAAAMAAAQMSDNLEVNA